MKAVGYKKSGSITAADALIEFEADKPVLREHDLLVEIKGISLNPVDYKVRSAMDPEEGEYKILGFDAAGIVKEVGSSVTKFKAGDEVFYAGDISRQGTNAELHAIDSRVVGLKPNTMDFPEAAGIPLTAITAWEILFDSFNIKEGEGEGKSILLIGAPGGVGSIMIQLVKKLTKLTVIATASRPETIEWVKKMGADHVINHHESIEEQINALELQPDYVASLIGTEKNIESIINVTKPRGHIAIIDNPTTINILPGKSKSLSFHLEFMFTRPMFETDDIEVQHDLLNRVSALIDDGILISTVTANLGTISVETLKAAHAMQEAGSVIGKQVLNGFE